VATLEYRRRYVADDLTAASRVRIVAWLLLAVALLAGGAMCGEWWCLRTAPPASDAPGINRLHPQAEDRTALVVSGLLLAASFSSAVCGVRVMMAPESRRSWAEQT
jgi:hypothetical protein